METRPSHGPQALTSLLATCSSRRTAAETKDKRNGTRPPSWVGILFDSIKFVEWSPASALIFRRPMAGLILERAQKRRERRWEESTWHSQEPSILSSTFFPFAIPPLADFFYLYGELLSLPIVLPARALLSHSRIPAGLPPIFARLFAAVLGVDAPFLRAPSTTNDVEEIGNGGRSSRSSLLSFDVAALWLRFSLPICVARRNLAEGTGCRWKKSAHTARNYAHSLHHLQYRV